MTPSEKELERKQKIDSREALASGDPAAIADANNWYERWKEKNREKKWYQALRQFYHDFKDGVNSATEDIKNTYNKDNAQKQDPKNKDNKYPPNKGYDLPYTFYRDYLAGRRGQRTGNKSDVDAAHLNTLGQLKLNSSAVHGMEAQSHQQKASINPRQMAAEDKVEKDVTQDQTNIAGAVGKNAAGLQRSNNALNTEGARQYTTEQQQMAEQNRDKQINDQIDAQQNFRSSQSFQIDSRDLNNDKDAMYRLSMGQERQDMPPENETKNEEQNPEAQPQNTETPDAMAGHHTRQPNEQPQTQQAPQKIGGNPQHVINAILGNQAGADLRAGNATQDQELYNAIVQKFGLNPTDSNIQDSMQQEGAADPKTMEAVKALRFGRSPDDPNKNFNNQNGMNQYVYIDENGNIVPSDERIKRIKAMVGVKDIVSDLRLKLIRDNLLNENRLTPEQFMLAAAHQGGKFNHNGKDYDFFSDNDWDDNDKEVINAYADHIKNYLYTYKPEATKIDNRIDPEQEHIGPMAQDIEKVNPACIKETPEGVKTVDTGRLAMMNAGAIGDLARELRELKEVLLHE